MMATQEEQELFGLKAGDVSKLEQEPAGYIIYKVESRQTVPMDRVKDEISRELFRQKMDAQLKSITAAVHSNLNDEYFGPSNPTPPAGALPRNVPGAHPGVPQSPTGPEPKPPAPSSPSAPPGSAPSPAAPGQAPPK
jgi:hypothetical protein